MGGFLKRPDCSIYYEITGQGPALAGYAPHGRSAVVPQAGHSVYFERAAQFNRDVEDFLEGA